MSALPLQQGLIASADPAGLEVPRIVRLSEFRQNTGTSLNIPLTGVTPGNLVLAFFAADDELAPVASGWIKLAGLKRTLATPVEDELSLQVYAKMADNESMSVSFSTALPSQVQVMGGFSIEVAGASSVTDAEVVISYAENGATVSPSPLVIEGAAAPTLWIAAAAWKSIDREVIAALDQYPENLPEDRATIPSQYVSGQYGAMPGFGLATLINQAVGLIPNDFAVDSTFSLALAATIGVRK